MFIILQLKKQLTFFLISVFRLYIIYSPIDKFKSILKKYIANKVASYKEVFLVTSKIGNKFLLLLPEDRPRVNIYSEGYCEINLTKLFINIINDDDIIFDIGANIGWYSVLFSQQGNKCYSFEPNPKVYKRLLTNCWLNRIDLKCEIENLAVGEKNGLVKFHTFKNLHHGLSSLSHFQRDDKEEILVESTSLFTYVQQKKIKHIDIIKVDVEGAELDVLNGFKELFNQGYFPIWTFELNNETSSYFGYTPSDLLSILSTYNYDFYLVRKSLVHINNFDDYANGDEVLCIIPEYHKQILKNSNISLG